MLMILCPKCSCGISSIGKLRAGLLTVITRNQDFDCSRQDANQQLWAYR
jgi:hypothetical protein